MQIDRSLFLVNKLDLENPTVLIWLEQADMTKGKNVIIGNPRLEEDAESTPSRKVVMEKLLDGEETITITIRGSTTGDHERKAEGSTLIRNDGRRKPTASDQEQAVQSPSGRSDHHDRLEQVTSCSGQSATRSGQAARDGQTARSVGQTASS
jgi:hypothetical protein